MKRVFVAERHGQPIDMNGLHVEALPTTAMAAARLEVTPLVRLKTERMVPYVSVETLEAFLANDGSRDGLETLIIAAWAGVFREGV